MDIGKALTLKFDETKHVKITRVHEDGVLLEWTTEAGAARTTTSLSPSASTTSSAATNFQPAIMGLGPLTLTLW